MEQNGIEMAILALGGLTVILAVVLVIANRVFYVYEDPRIDKVEDMLPHANCGACGLPGCRNFAEALVKGEASPGKCTVGTEEMQLGIAAYLKVDVGGDEKKIARIACQGGINVARNKARYSGLKSCRAASQVGGGPKSCSWGCLGFGDCEFVCDFDAIHMNQFSLPVVTESNCTGCNACVEVCPKNLFTLEPQSRRLWVACKSQKNGDEVLAECAVGCNACERCVRDAAPGLMHMENNLPVVDYARNQFASESIIQRCPTGAIVWLDKDGNHQKGRDASKKVLRKTPLPNGGV